MTVYLGNPACPTVQITGELVPPSAKPKFNSIQVLTNASSRRNYEGAKMGHLLGGGTLTTQGGPLPFVSGSDSMEFGSCQNRQIPLFLGAGAHLINGYFIQEKQSWRHFC